MTPVARPEADAQGTIESVKSSQQSSGHRISIPRECRLITGSVLIEAPEEQTQERMTLI